ncbi:MAG: NAD(P)/FAD-dependent oxidoreductase [Paracoccaceae bacterium]
MRQQLSTEAFDVVVIGAGVVGCAVARRFTLEGAKVAIVEKGTDILDGASKANSAILHTGYDAPNDSLELSCIRTGYEEYEAIRGDFGLVQHTIGGLVVAWTQDEMNALDDIVAKSHRNGVTDVTFIDANALQKKEPNLSKWARGAVWVPKESIIDPWSAPYVYLRQAIENGAEIFVSSAVTGGSFNGEAWQLETARGSLRARNVINCAGLFGDLVDRDVLGEAQFKIMPRKGQFVVFDKAARSLVNSVILPVPDEKTKGIVVFPTVFGNLVVGPTAEEQQSRSDAATDSETLQTLINDGNTKIPRLSEMPVTAVYAGIRPATERKEYRIHATPEKNWITVGGIRSTGLSASLGIARHVFNLYRDQGNSHDQLQTPECPSATMLDQSGQRDWQRADHGEIICHCELVTRREIEAALQGPLAARSLGGLKRKTRATMGSCQGFYCSARLAELTNGKLERPLAREMEHE